jgi:signal transduction histidine kinase
MVCVLPLANDRIGGEVDAGGRCGPRIAARLALVLGRAIRHFMLFALTAWLPFEALSGFGEARAQQNPPRVLVLYPYNTAVPANVLAGETAKKRLNERSQKALDFYTEFLDFARFAGAQHELRTAQHLAEKYHDQKPAVVMAMGPQALRFVTQNKDTLGFGIPIVFCCTSRTRLAALKPDANVTGIISEFDLTKTLAVAQRLQPDARSIVVVSGASAFDRQWAEIARRQLGAYEQKYQTSYLNGLPQDELISKLKLLPRNTIVILLTIFADGTGRAFIPTEAARDIASASSAPVYSPYESQLGSGVVGGHMDSFEWIGNEVADLAYDILAGATAIPPPRATTGNADRVDWRQLQRWSFSESNLSPSTEVRFRELTMWQQYRWHMIGILAIVLAQAAIISWLYVEHHRRLRAEQEVRRRLLEVLHLNRSATAGALSASIAHELNQPLGAILSYAEAAEIYLKAVPPNIERVEQILGNIRRDDQRAAEIITHFRGLLKKTDAVELQEFNVNDVVRDAVHILDPEAVKRGVTLSTHQAGGNLPVRADQVHLQQVILNLAVNAMDAMQNCVKGTGKMSIQTVLAGDSEVEVSVNDSGTGIPADKLSEVFDTFYTTKRQGTGLGLSIARTIVETYGGKIWAENRPGGGAAFRFTLPLSKGLVA